MRIKTIDTVSSNTRLFVSILVLYICVLDIVTSVLFTYCVVCLCFASTLSMTRVSVCIDWQEFIELACQSSDSSGLLSLLPHTRPRWSDSCSNTPRDLSVLSVSVKELVETECGGI